MNMFLYLYRYRRRYYPQLSFLIVLIIYITLSIYLYSFFSSYVMSNEIFSYVMSNEINEINKINELFPLERIIIEDAQGSLEVSYKTNKGKRHIVKSYPIEILVIYSQEHYDSKRILMLDLLNAEKQFYNVKTITNPQLCWMWSPDLKTRDIGRSDWLKGETYLGIKRYNKNISIDFKFTYFIQDAFGYDLEALYKAWPALNRVINKKLSSNFIYNNFNYKDYDLRISVKISTLKIRKGYITQSINDISITTEFYKKIIKEKIAIFVKDKYNSEVIILNEFNAFYAEFFTKKYNLRYVKKLYRNFDLNKEIEFLIKTYDYLKKFYK